MEGERNPVHGYRRSDLVDPWSRYLPVASGTTDTTGTAQQADARLSSPVVPDVPAVPVDPGMGPLIFDPIAAAWRVFGDDIDWVVGTA
jgi:hypothetical protein